MVSGRQIATAFGALLAVLFVLLAALAVSQDVARPRADLSGETRHIGEDVRFVLDYSDIGRVDADTYAALAARMAGSNGTMPSAGFRYYQHGMLWFSFVVPSLDTAETSWAIRLDDYRVQTARLILIDDDFREFVWRHDDPVHMAGLGGREPIFRFERSAIEGKTVLIGFTALAALRADAYVATDRATDAEELRRATVLSFLSGGLFAIALFLFVIGLRLRAVTLLAAAGMITWLGLFLYASLGYLRSVWLVDFPLLADGLLYGTEPLLLSFTLLTIVAYVELPRVAPRVATFVVALALIVPLQGVLEFAVTIGLPVPLFVDFFPVVIVSTLAALSVLVWAALFKGSDKARLFLFAILPIAVGGLMRVYSYLNAVPASMLLALDSSVDVVVSMLLLGLLVVLDLQKRQEVLRQAAERNERRFRGFAEIASDSYFETDAEGRILSVAGRLVESLTLVEGAMLPAALSRAAAPGQDEALERIGRAVAARADLRDVEIATGSASTKSRWVSINIGPHQTVGGVSGTITDVTERVERRNREAREATLSALGQLASGVAHEVNNLLHPIVNLARRVRDLQENSETRKLLDVVVSSGQHAGQIVAGVLDAFNPAASSGARKPIAEALSDAVLAVRPTLPSTVVLNADIQADVGIEVVPGEMLQIITNLVSNSLRAMDGKGRIDIALHTDDPGITRLAVADNGPGMSEEMRARATEPFVSGRVVGTGLGLSLVATIVRRWNGELTIDSAIGAGTRVTIILPTPTREA